MRALALLALALLVHSSSSARVLLQDPQEPAQDDAMPLESEVTDIDGETVGFVKRERSCDLSADDAWSTADCSMEDDGTQITDLSIGGRSTQATAHAVGSE
jgi:hypothetical protein